LIISDISDNNHIRLSGKSFFHKIFISVSYRSRGRDPSIQININDKRAVFIITFVYSQLFVKINTVIMLIRKILMYSAIKIIAKTDVLYSMLKPYTSSDSPSVKSNGVRCVSARIEIIQVSINGISITDIHDI